WYRREARRILSERRDKTIVPWLRKILEENKGELALEALWAIYVSDGFDDSLAFTTLRHANDDVRAWTVRLLCDPKKVSPRILTALVALACSDPSPTVRSQLACSAKRLPGAECLAIVRQLLWRKEDVSDPHIPLLLWWAIEDKAISHREQILALLHDPAA